MSEMKWRERIKTISGIDRGEPVCQTIIQFIKFGLVGVSNTAISYGIEMLCFYILFARLNWPDRSRILLSTALAFTVSIVNSYYWNNRFVFTDANRKAVTGHVIAFMKMALCYALTGLLLSPLLKVWMHERGIAYWAASLLTLIITVPLNYVLNKLWAFRER